MVAGRYEIKDPPIGQGGMGVVYKAYDTVTRRFVALKTIWGGLSSQALELFEKEWSVLARLSHPNIVDILETGEFEEAGQHKPYFVMPLLPGATLDHLIKKASTRLTVERTVDIMVQACRGLQAAHDHGLVHRDLKPSNIFVMDDDSVKLIDFGVVHLSDTHSMTGIKGTLHFLAPELLDHKAPSVLSDVFALGVVTYEALTRRKPFDLPTEAEVFEAIRSYIPPPVSDINSSVNEALSRTIAKAMAKQPWHRFSSSREYAEVLKKALRNEPIEYFDSAKIQPRIERVKKAQAEGDFQFAREILSELEAEGHIDLQISLLRMQLDQAIKQKTIRQLMESARTRVEEEEYPLALQKVQEVLEIDPNNTDALRLKTQIERQRNEKQIDNWYRLVQQHIENQYFSQARMGLEEILRVNPADAKAHSLLDQVDRLEKDASKARAEKEQLYQSALKAYQCGEVSTALDKLERLLEISRNASRTSTPEKDAQYQSLYNQIRSEREALRAGYAEARRCLEDKNFSKAAALCNEFLTKNPNDPMFQALKLEVDERDRQERSAAVADIDQKVETEADLDRKINILREAVDNFPNEAHFKESLKLVRGRRDLLDSIVSRAKQYEQNSQFNEALGQWDILHNIYPQYPGFDAEVQRLKLKREAQLREESRSRWVRQIDQHLEAGEYDKAQQAVRDGLAEFPEDRELASLDKLAIQGAEKHQQAHEFLAEGRQSLASGDTSTGLNLLRNAVELDGRDRTLRGAFLSALLEQARLRLNADWRESQSLVEEALKLDATNPVARSLSAQIQDRERQALVDATVLEARELQAAGNLAGALDKVREAMARHPRESRLAQLETTLLNSMDSKTRSRFTDPQSPPSSPQRGRSTNTSGLQPSEAATASLIRSDKSAAAAAPAPVTGSSQLSEALTASLVRTDKTPSTTSPAGTASPAPIAQPSAAIAPTSPLTVAPAPAQAQRQASAKSKLASSIKLWAAIVLVPILAVAAFVGYKFAKRRAPQPPSAPLSVALTANIPDTTFSVDGNPATSPVVLEPGQEHVIQATHAGYQASVQRVTTVAGQATAPVQFTLTPLLPRMEILSDIKNATVAIGEQPETPLTTGSLAVDQIAPGAPVIRIFNGSSTILILPLKVEPGKVVELAGPLQANGYSVAVASILGERARMFATSDLKANVTGQDPQPIPAEGLEAQIQSATSTFTLSNDQTLNLEPSNQPHLIVLLSALEESQAHATNAMAHLLLSSLPPDSVLHIDGDSQPAGAGTAQVPLRAGVHKIYLSRPHFEDSAAKVIHLKPGATEKISAADFVLQPQGAVSFKITPSAATVTYSSQDPKSGAVPRKARAGDIVWLKPGKYTAKLDAPGYAGDQSDFEIKAGSAPFELKRSLKAVAADTPAPSSTTASPEGTGIFENMQQWKHEGEWWVWKGSTYAWLRPSHGVFDVTIQRPKKGLFRTPKRIEWTIDYASGDRIVYSINDNAFHRLAYHGDSPVSDQAKDLSKYPGDFHFTFDVSARHVAVTEAGGDKIDDYERPNPGVPLGKIGFKGEITVTVQQK
ncbi:MAG TPA: protein kinase [Candidatus Angelobacter sp.]|nr:protein kinase [Candidatus Angelobacter sp.]